MWLVFCEATDVVGSWAFLGLKKRGLEPVRIVLPDELTFGAEYVHRLSATSVDTELRLKGDQPIASHQISGVFNRLVEMPPEYLDLVGESDRDYIQEEFHAFFMSWMNSLACPVLNPPGATYLFGEWYHVSEWLSLANQVGLPILPYVMSSHPEAKSGSALEGPAPDDRKTALVIGDHVIAPGASDAIALGCHSLASLVDLPVLGLEFVVTSDNQWLFCGASPLPDLRMGGQHALEALAQTLNPNG